MGQTQVFHLATHYSARFVRLFTVKKNSLHAAIFNSVCVWLLHASNYGEHVVVSPSGIDDSVDTHAERRGPDATLNDDCNAPVNPNIVHGERKQSIHCSEGDKSKQEVEE